MFDQSTLLAARDVAPGPCCRALAGTFDDHALLPWRFHAKLRAAAGTLRA